MKEEIEIKDLITRIFDKVKIEQERGNATFEIIKWDYKSIYIDKLVSLYKILETEKEKKYFIWFLLEGLISDYYEYEKKVFVWVSHICFFTLTFLWYSKIATEVLQESFEESPWFKAIMVICGFLTEETNIFRKEDLDSLIPFLQNIKNSNIFYNKTWSHGFERYIKELINGAIWKIIDIRFNDFDKIILHHDIEIETDKKQVQEYLKRFWFEEKYERLLNSIDKLLQNQDISEEDFVWWVIWSFRQFYDDFYIDLATKISKLNWLDTFPKNISKEKTSSFWHALHYIWQEFNVSKDEEKLLMGYYWVSNWQWAHRLLSNKKYFRLTRNIWIEICLFLLSKLEDYTKSEEK